MLLKAKSSGYVHWHKTNAESGTIGMIQQIYSKADWQRQVGNAASRKDGNYSKRIVLQVLTKILTRILFYRDKTGSPIVVYRNWAISIRSREKAISPNYLDDFWGIFTLPVGI